jgi:hypothetical protein
MKRDTPASETGNTPVTEDELREQPMSDLREEAAERDLVIDGTGKDGAIVKEDLVTTIAAADALFDDGRPPLAEVAQAASERDRENAIDMREPTTE